MLAFTFTNALQFTKLVKLRLVINSRYTVCGHAHFQIDSLRHSEMLLYVFQIITNLPNRTKKMKKLKICYNTQRFEPSKIFITEGLKVKFQPSSQP